MNQLKCPFCHENNHCQSKSTKACWCFTTKVPDELIQMIPEQPLTSNPNKSAKQTVKISCICKTCVESFLNDPIKFKQTYISK